MLWEPKRYQLNAVKFMALNPRCGVLLDPGMGKTSVTLTSVEHFRGVREINRVLVIAPIRPMYLVWPKEIKKWDHLNHLSCTILHGDKKDQALNQVSDIYLLNPEGLKWFMENGGMDRIKPDMLVVDESTKFKDSQSKRFKLLKPYLPQFKRRVILTGEISPNGYEDLFGQIYIVDRGDALGKFITHYRNAYFDGDYSGYSYTLRPGSDKLIQERIKPIVMRLAAEDHLEMPDLIFDDILIELDPESRRVYDDFEAEFLVELGDATLIAPNAAAAGSKCRQVANGGVYDEFHIAHPLHDLKTQALADLVEQLQGNPILVFYEFQHDLDRLKRVFPTAPCMTGATGKKLGEMESEFNKGTIPVLLAHPASAGHGLNLQEACHHVCFYGLTWDLDLYHQAYKRVWRQGNPSNHVVVHRILADKTLDKQVAKVLLEKQKSATDLCNALKRREE